MPLFYACALGCGLMSNTNIGRDSCGNAGSNIFSYNFRFRANNDHDFRSVLLNNIRVFWQLDAIFRVSITLRWNEEMFLLVFRRLWRHLPRVSK